VIINIEWHEQDLRPLGREDAMFYHYSNANTHQLICTVSDGTNSVSVYCDGEMRVIYKPEDTLIKDSVALVEAGILNDEYLQEAWFDNDTFDVVNNTWYDLYGSNGLWATTHEEHLDCIYDTLTDSIERCITILEEWETQANDNADA